MDEEIEGQREKAADVAHPMRDNPAQGSLTSSLTHPINKKEKNPFIHNVY